MKNVKIGVIYKYTSPSGKIYIGQTINEPSRKSQHKNGTSKTNTYFGKAIRKYGWENFKYETIIKFKPTLEKEKLKKVLDKLEKRYINLFKSNDRKFGYNLNDGGEGNIGYAHSEESKEKISNAIKSRLEDPIQKEIIINNLRLGSLTLQSHSNETKEKMSLKCKNKKCVSQYDSDLNLIATFSSISDAAKSMNGDATHKTKSNRISECISGKWKSAYGFLWVRE